jgi:hypothetical protein
MENEIIEAVREHADKVQKTAAADRLEIKALGVKNVELQDTLNDVLLEVAALRSNPGALGRGGNDASSPVAEFIKSAPQLQAMRDGATGTGKVMLKSSSLKVLAKSISNTGIGQAGDTPYNVRPIATH